jgi:FAD/FMN-containing dehydrogenase
MTDLPYHRDGELIPFGQLASRISGRLDTGETLRRLYATDASEYQELPAGVVFPESEEDLREVIRFARRNRLGLIPRAAGTSLAGQCVGDGLGRRYLEALHPYPLGG